MAQLRSSLAGGIARPTRRPDSTDTIERRGRRRLVSGTLTLAGVVALALAATGLAGSARTELVSVSSTGEPGIGGIMSPVSADGRYVAFTSRGSDLVAGDTNGTMDVFVRDRMLDTTERVSVASDGNQGNGRSRWAAISADGRYVAFASNASNLVPGDTNRDGDVFVRDRKLDTTRRVSVSSTGHQGNDASLFPAISADGRWVAFTSWARNLVAGDTNNREPVFVRGPLH